MDQSPLSAISGISGSISIACWIVVFSPQIIENFRRASADGLSIVFIIVWLLGDVFNILGAVLQGVLPTMIILAVYYTIADIVLLAQCFYYKGFTLSDDVPSSSSSSVKQKKKSKPARMVVEEEEQEQRQQREETEHTPLLPNGNSNAAAGSPSSPPRQQQQRTTSSTFRPALLNTTAVLLVCLAGILGWWLTLPRRHNTTTPQPPSHRLPPSIPAPAPKKPLHIHPLGQIFGYLSAGLYLGARLPQLLLNYRRKSTEGVSMLFFIFACLGNLTYTLSILAFDPVCEDDDGGQQCRRTAVYGRYMLVNASWLLGSVGTLMLDLGIFAQFWIYRRNEDDEEEEEGRDCER